MKKTIKCANCGKTLFEFDDEKDKSLLYSAKQNGFVPKIFFLYGIYEPTIFCNKVCCNTYFKNNISKENKTKGDESIEKFKKRIPQMSKDVCNALSKFQKVINKIRENKNKDV